MITLANANGAITKQYKYDAFGVEENPGVFDTNVFRYCAEYFDVETNTIYLRARYYDAQTGRFTQQDGWNYAVPGFLLSLNLYTYFWNNPIKYSDPSGRFVIATSVATAFTITEVFKLIAVGTAAIAGIGVATHVGEKLGDALRVKHTYDAGTISKPGFEYYPRFYEPKTLGKGNALSRENITVISRDIAVEKSDNDDNERRVYYLAYAPKKMLIWCELGVLIH